MRILHTSSMAGKARRTFAVLALLLLAAALFSLCLGASGISLWTGLTDVLRGVDSAPARIILHIRLPRTLAAMLAGAALSCAGVMIQGVLGNPLAGPNVIGVNAGAGLTTLLLASLAPSAVALLPAAAFAGALGASLLILFLADRMGASRLTVVLAGVAVSSMLGAGSDLLTTLNPEATLGMSSFLMGGFSGLTASRLRAAACYVLPALVMAHLMAADLDILGLGDEVAASLGMRVRRTRVMQLVAASVLAGGAVSFAGLLGFVGLIVPHAMRRLVGGEHRCLMPVSMLGGALLTTVCDLLARTMFSPYEIPVGILLSLLGGPFFLWLLVRSGKRGARK